MPKGIPKNGINKGWYQKGQSSLNKGKRVSFESRLKMSISHKGIQRIFSDKHKKNLSISLKGKSKPWLLGKKRIFTLQWKKNLSIGHRFQDRSLLKQSDRQNSGAYYEWRKEVRNRDGNKCKIGNSDCKGILNTHHILSWREYPELRYEINNGITLCRFHHPLKHLEEKRLSPYFTNLVLKNI